MFGAAAVRNKKRKQAQQQGAAAPRGPYIKPFGPRFDPSELPYFKYKRALQEAKELQHNINKAKKAARKKHKRRHHQKHNQAVGSDDDEGDGKGRKTAGDALRALQEQAGAVGSGVPGGHSVRTAAEKLKASMLTRRDQCEISGLGGILLYYSS